MCINLSILIEILFEKTTNYKIMFPIQIIVEIYNKYSYGVYFSTTTIANKYKHKLSYRITV